MKIKFEKVELIPIGFVERLANSKDGIWYDCTLGISLNLFGSIHKSTEAIINNITWENIQNSLWDLFTERYHED